MKEGLRGVACTDARQAGGTAPGGSRRSVSGDDALLTTARAARTVRPPRSRTPVGQQGPGVRRVGVRVIQRAPPRCSEGSHGADSPPLLHDAALPATRPRKAAARRPTAALTDRAPSLHQHLVDVRAQAQRAAVLGQPAHQGRHHGLAAAARELQHAVGLVPLLKHEGNFG